jgi:hypothetical protein
LIVCLGNFMKINNKIDQVYSLGDTQ